MKFLEYFPKGSLVSNYSLMMNDLRIETIYKERLVAFTEPLRLKSVGTNFHYVHSQRVAIVSTLTAAMMHLDPKPAFYAGMLHDIGKMMIPEEQLTKESGWSDRDAEIMSRHVDYAHEMLRGSFDFTAAVIVWHHRFQRRGYPKKLPPKIRNYEPSLEILIPVYGMFLTIADVYDAMHRVNDGGPLDGDEIKKRMLDLRPEWSGVVGSLYNSGILTTETTTDDRESKWGIPRLADFGSGDHFV